MPATRATAAAGRPAATGSRERATRSVTPIPARTPPEISNSIVLRPRRALEAAVALAQLVELRALGALLRRRT